MRWKEKVMVEVTKRAKVATIFLGVVAVFIGVVSPTGATPPQGPVMIETNIDFTEFPFSGEFVVTVGAGLLGCSSGTFEDFPASNAPAPSAIDKVFTCTDGGSGQFVATFRPTLKPGPGDGNGHWNVTSGTGDFARLRGQGDFSVMFTDFDPVTGFPTAGMETLTGDVHFD